MIRFAAAVFFARIGGDEWSRSRPWRTRVFAASFMDLNDALRGVVAGIVESSCSRAAEDYYSKFSDATGAEAGG